MGGDRRTRGEGRRRQDQAHAHLPTRRVFPHPSCGRKSPARRAEVGPVDCPSHAPRVRLQATARPPVLRHRLPGERPVRHLRVRAVERTAGPARSRTRARVDVAVLDMNHGWPNLGHDSLVHAVMDASCEVTARARGGRAARAGAVVRRAPLGHAAGARPEPRFSLYLGTGGPGHLDPRANDGVRPESQGIREDAVVGASRRSAVRRDPAPTSRRRCSPSATPSACCAAGRARPRPCCAGRRRASAAASSRTCWRCRRPSTPGSAASPSSLGPSARLRVVENRLFDLIPARGGFPAGRRAARLRDARRGRRAGRRGHDDRVRARRERRHAAHVRGEPPPRDRRPLPPGDDPRPEARSRRGDRRVVPRAPRDPDRASSPRRTSTSGCT